MKRIQMTAFDVYSTQEVKMETPGWIVLILRDLTIIHSSRA